MGAEFLPQGFTLPDGTRTGRLTTSGTGWQIFASSEGSSTIAVLPELYERWIRDGFIGERLFTPCEVNGSVIFVLTSKKGYITASVQQGSHQSDSAESRAFAFALSETRKTAGSTPLHDAVYVEQFSLLLPTYTQTEPLSDDAVLKLWLSGSMHVSATQLQGQIFRLPGRPSLEAFFNEHVIDIVRNAEKYSIVGIDFPSAIVLYGPPGCGKTFAVERLAEFLAWPIFRIDSGSIGSPYINETSRKTAEIFDEAAHNSPSMIVIDEMDAFLSDRSAGTSGTHHAEEVSEFLRRIPEAPKKHVLVVAMTNRLDVIDPALLRHGRFDHIIAVDMPTVHEVRDLLLSLFEGLPLSPEVDIDVAAEKLAGRALSDAAFVVKEAGRLSVREGKDYIDAKMIEAALGLLSRKENDSRIIGFGG